MISFVKFAAVFSAGLIAAAAWAGKTDDGQAPPKPDAKDSGEKKKKSKGAKGDGTAKKTLDVPVVKGHDSIGLSIPYFDSEGKRQMNFKIGVASRVDDNHVQMKDLKIETFDENGEHEMSIDLPTSVLDTDTSVLTGDQRVTVRRSDFELTGDRVIFFSKTKQGGLAGNVHMLIYNLIDEPSDATNTPESKEK